MDFATLSEAGIAGQRKATNCRFGGVNCRVFAPGSLYRSLPPDENGDVKNALLPIVFASVLLCGAPGAQALSHLEPDPTGLWFDPAQPGWGLEVAQQGDTAFAVLFTYDAGHNPVWYVASNLSNSVDFNELPALMKGTLYRTAGPAFSAGSFDPRAVTTTAVGDLQISYVAPGIGATGSFDPGSPRQLAVSYSIDGIPVSKTLRAQTWSIDPENLVGAYGGHFFLAPFPASEQSAACPDSPLVLPIQPFQPYGFSIVAGSARDHVTLLWGSGIDLGCTGDMKFERDGQLAGLAGNVQCAPIGFVPDGTGVPVAVRDIVMGQAGISGSAAARSSTATGGLPCSYAGEFGGVITAAQPRTGMSPDPTGVWFNPSESGWGLILTQQGANVFAALFAYDADGKPTWWVASNVTDSGKFVNFLVGETFAGTLYRTTGPYFGNPSDTTPFAAISVGTLQVANIGGTDHLALEYSVGGTTIDKTVQRQTWANMMSLLGGTYTGGLFPAASACGTSGFFAMDPTTFIVSPNPDASSLQVRWPTGPGTGCVLDASYVQTGQLATISGPVHCGAVDNPQAAPGTLTIIQATVSSSGFSGFANFNAFATLDGPACTAGGFVGGVRH